MRDIRGVSGGLTRAQPFRDITAGHRQDAFGHGQILFRTKGMRIGFQNATIGKAQLIDLMRAGILGRGKDADRAAGAAIVDCRDFVSAQNLDLARGLISSNPAKSTCRARVRFHSVSTVGDESPRSIWLTMLRDTPDSLATASSDRPFA